MGGPDINTALFEKDNYEKDLTTYVSLLQQRSNHDKNIELANLKPGEFRQVKNDELQVLYNSCNVNKN